MYCYNKHENVVHNSDWEGWSQNLPSGVDKKYKPYLEIVDEFVDILKDYVRRVYCGEHEKYDGLLFFKVNISRHDYVLFSVDEDKNVKVYRDCDVKSITSLYGSLPIESFEWDERNNEEYLKNLIQEAKDTSQTETMTPGELDNFYRKKRLYFANQSNYEWDYTNAVIDKGEIILDELQKDYERKKRDPLKNHTYVKGIIKQVEELIKSARGMSVPVRGITKSEADQVNKSYFDAVIQNVSNNIIQNMKFEFSWKSLWQEM